MAEDVEALMRQGLISPSAYDKVIGGSAMDATGYATKARDDYGNTLPDATESAAKVGPSWWATALEGGASRLDVLRNMWGQGSTVSEIASKLGASKQAIIDQAKGLPTPQGFSQGDRINQARQVQSAAGSGFQLTSGPRQRPAITWDEDMLRVARDTSKTQMQRADEIGVDVGTLRRLLNRGSTQ